MSSALRRSQPAPRKVEAGTQTRNQAAAATTQPQVAAKATRSLRMSHLTQLRMMIDELILKADARDCLREQGRDRYANRIPCDRDFQNLLASLQDYVESHRNVPVEESASRSVSTLNSSISNASVIRTTVGQISPANQRKRGRVRIQLKVSRGLLQILEALQKNNIRPGDTVEAILWESQRIQDLAHLLGVGGTTR